MYNNNNKQIKLILTIFDPDPIYLKYCPSQYMIKIKFPSEILYVLFIIQSLESIS